MPVPRKHKLLFWLLIAAYSTFFAEVFAGSDLFPYYHLWGVAVVVPLYGLHSLILTTLIYRYGRPRLSTLVFAGMLFGLYEAYMTKVLWNPDWGAVKLVADVAVVEVFVLVFWWHTWLSYITPLILGERLLTASSDVLSGLPKGLRRFYGSWKGWLAIALFGALFQSINSPDPLASLLSGLSTVGMLVALTVLWRRVSRGRDYALAALLPGERAFRWMVVWLGAQYLFLGFAIYPERLPPVWPGQALIWGLYGVVIALFVRALRRSRRVEAVSAEPPPFPSERAFLGLGLFFIIALPLARALTGGAAPFIALTGWAGGIALGVWGFLRAWKEVRA